MASSSERVCALNKNTNYYSPRVVRLVLKNLSKIKRQQSVNKNTQLDNSPQQTEGSSLDTEDQSVVVNEIENEVLSQPVAVKDDIDIDQHYFDPPTDIKQEFNSEGHLSHLQLQNSNLTPGQKITASPNVVTLENPDHTPKLPRPGIEAQETQLINMSPFLNSPLVPVTEDDSRFLDIVQTPASSNDLNLPEPDPTPSTSSSAFANPLLPSEVPSSVTLTFESSDEEENPSKIIQSTHDPVPSISGTTPLPQKTKVPFLELQQRKAVTPGPDLDFNNETNKNEELTSGSYLASKTTVAPVASSSIVLADSHESASLHSELCLPLDNEELKAELDTSLPGPSRDPRIFSKHILVVLPVFIEGPKDAMFLEEVSMTVRQFNELLENLFLLRCFQVPGSEGRLKLETVLKFLVKGESIANLAQEYKIGKNTFTKYLPEVLDAIFKMLGLLRAKVGENQWSGVQKSFEERLGLPNCCGVLNATTIITWRPSSPTCLPLITLTDADYNFLYLDMEANIEDHGIDFKTTRMYSAIHTTKTLSIFMSKHGFVVGNKHLLPTNFVSPQYSDVGEDMPIPHLFNGRVEKALRVSENALGILSTKFKVYDKIMTLSPNVAKAVIKATCALHNWLKQTAPGYLTPGLVDLETKGEVILGSWRFNPRQIFQPVHFFSPPYKYRRRGPIKKYDVKRDHYAFNLYNMEKMKNSQDTTTYNSF